MWIKTSEGFLNLDYYQRAVRDSHGFLTLFESGADLPRTVLRDPADVAKVEHALTQVSWGDDWVGKDWPGDSADGDAAPDDTTADTDPDTGKAAEPVPEENTAATKKG
jgi:hypothetical protein